MYMYVYMRMYICIFQVLESNVNGTVDTQSIMSLTSTNSEEKTNMLHKRKAALNSIDFVDDILDSFDLSEEAVEDQTDICDTTSEGMSPPSALQEPSNKETSSVFSKRKGYRATKINRKLNKYKRSHVSIKYRQTCFRDA